MKPQAKLGAHELTWVWSRERIGCVSNRREFDDEAIYQISVSGSLDQKWSDWFGGFTITAQGDDETLLMGPVADQAALHGLFAKIRDLGLPILSVRRVGTDE